ncbi:hypothetical protein K1719_035898 [Acacia pycnantha]|nr:hypothetical protein K1719_035898 [Acacia pycnantha]
MAETSEISVFTLGGKGSSLSSSSLYAAASGRAQLRIDSSALDRLSSGQRLPPASCKHQIIFNDFLTLEDRRAFLVVLLNKLLLSNARGIRALLPELIVEALNSKSQNLKFEEVNVTEDEMSVLESSYSSLLGVSAILDHQSAALSALADFGAAVSCEASKADVSSFDFMDSGELNSAVGTEEAVSVVLWTLAAALRYLGKCSLARVKTNLASMPSNELRSRLEGIFAKKCPADSSLERAFGLYLSEDFCNFVYRVKMLLDTVWNIVAWEVVTAFAALEPVELTEKIQVVGANGDNTKPEKKNEKKKKDPEFDVFLSKIKDFIESNESRRLPKVPKGTRDFAKEYGEDSKLIYDLADQGGKLCSLRYDLTVPFARYVAMNGLTSFRGYQFGKSEKMGPDFEIVRILTEVLDELDIRDYEIKLNHRKLLDGMMEICGVPAAKFRTICSSIDKLDKQSFDHIRREMMEENRISAETADKIGTFVKEKGPPLALLSKFKQEGSAFLEHAGSVDALNDLEILFKALDKSKSIGKVVFDLSLARGLDYYTGVIFEAVLKGGAQVGSIAGGGRYDNLIGMFGSKQVPAVGVSLGIERIYAIMEQRHKDRNQMPRAIKTEVLVGILGDDLTLASELASELWDVGIEAEFIYLVHL